MRKSKGGSKSAASNDGADNSATVIPAASGGVVKEKVFQTYLAKYALAAIIFSIGASIFLYPTVSAVLNERSQTVLITTYNDAVKELSEEQKDISLEEARAYNASLVGHQTHLNDPFKDPRFGENPTYSYLKIGDIMGYLEVPKVGIALPIYEGTSDAVLKRGSGWLEGSSLPVGGESTHTVLTGHNGLPTSRLFTDITKLEVGDEFFIRNFAEILAYRVVEIQVVEPHEVAGMGIVKGKDLATLLTCYPYMINSHRLLVTGERIPYTGQLEQAAQDAQGFNFLANLTPVQRNFVLTIVGTLAVLIIFIILGILAYRRQRKRGKTDGS